jgi:hypothetical protein
MRNEFRARIFVSFRTRGFRRLRGRDGAKAEWERQTNGLLSRMMSAPGGRRHTDAKQEVRV